jgi:hypothetical protein
VSQPYTARVKEGRVYLVLEEPMDNEPILRRYWWLMNVRPEQVKDGGLALHTGCGYMYVERNPAAFCSSSFISVPFDGKAQAAGIDREPIPAPKTRRGEAVRYRSGRWEKWTKRRGWVSS